MKAIAALIAVTLTTSVPALKFTAPEGWVPKTTTSTARLADFTLPKVAGDAEDATATVYFFGGTGGSIQANLDRWIGQMAQPDGSASRDKAKTTTLASASGLKITLVDVTGTYVAEVTPGSAEKFNKPGFRQLAAVIETPGGPHFVKVVGPAKTVAKWEASVSAFLKTLAWATPVSSF